MKHTSNSLRLLDFWLLGGLSLLVWAVLTAAEPLRGQFQFLGSRFAQLGATFAFLSLVCNHPHFMASYKMAYSRGWKFSAQNWFPLFAVPAMLLAGFGFAFTQMHNPSFNEGWTLLPNSLFALLGLSFRFGQAGSLGQEILHASIWLMYASVGWHYAKQAFGCMMVYANYDRYPLTLGQRRLVKFSLFAVAIYNFSMIGSHSGVYFPPTTPLQFSGMEVLDLGISPLAVPASGCLLAALLLGLGIFVLGKNFWEHRQLPSANFLVPLLAFLVWWIPVLPQREFYFMLVPFFHSLQYLAFASRVEGKSMEGFSEWRVALRLCLYFVIGVFAFEALPEFLTASFPGDFSQSALFFPIAVVIFINVHHYFLDSAIWKFQSPEVKDALLSPGDSSRIDPSKAPIVPGTLGIGPRFTFFRSKSGKIPVACEPMHRQR